MNQLEQINVVHTGPRQTPQREFGAVLSQAVAVAASATADVVSVVAPGNPVLSAAVSSVRAFAQTALRSSSPTASLGGGSGDPISALDANRQLMTEGAQMNLAYLELQQRMQQESQQFTAVSNLMKVRHESAKAAINNIR